jgi:hypothetical protein
VNPPSTTTTKRTKSKVLTEIESYRRDNVRWLIDSGVTSTLELARRMGFNPQNVSHWLMRNARARTYSISENTARKIEQALQLQTGVLDKPDLGGLRPMLFESKLGDRALLALEQAEERLRVKLSRSEREKLAEFLAGMLKAGQPLTADVVDTTVRLVKQL